MGKRRSLPIVLQVQDVATGHVLGDETFVDEFTGELVPMAIVQGPRVPPKDGEQLVAERRARKSARASAICALLTPKAKAIPKPFKRRI